MSVRVLHIRDCPNWQQAHQNVEEALLLLGIEAIVETMEISNGSQSLAENC